MHFVLAEKQIHELGSQVWYVAYALPRSMYVHMYVLASTACGEGICQLDCNLSVCSLRSRLTEGLASDEGKKRQTIAEQTELLYQAIKYAKLIRLSSITYYYLYV
jgi:hypothetical protein